jgi:PAS domain S-box-containing protein
MEGNDQAGRATVPPRAADGPSPEQAALFYRNIFEHSVWGIFQSTEDGFYLSVNPALARIYGYDGVAELLEALTDIGAQLYVDPFRRREFTRLVAEHGVLSGFESQVRRRDGTVIWISESCREVRGIDGEFLYYEGMVEEITQRKQAEEELRAAKEMAEVADRAKTEFLATISHELRTPLNAVIGFAELIRDEAHGSAGNPAYRDYAREICESGRHLLALIGDILDFVRADSGRFVLQDEEFEIGALANGAMQAMRAAAQAGGVALDCRVENGPLPIRGDERRLKQVLLNLLGNAVKFTPRGGKVALAVRRSPDAVVVEVRDTGIGIAEADLAHVKEPFRQADSRLNRKYEGTGLGLAISDRLVRLHGGRLELASKLGQGTVATVTLPRR